MACGTPTTRTPDAHNPKRICGGTNACFCRPPVPLSGLSSGCLFQSIFPGQDIDDQCRPQTQRRRWLDALVFSKRCCANGHMHLPLGGWMAWMDGDLIARSSASATLDWIRCHTPVTFLPPHTHLHGIASHRIVDFALCALLMRVRPTSTMTGHDALSLLSVMTVIADTVSTFLFCFFHSVLVALTSGGRHPHQGRHSSTSSYRPLFYGSRLPPHIDWKGPVPACKPFLSAQPIIL